MPASLSPLVWLKILICRLHLAAVLGLIEFCYRCGRRVNQVWHVDDALWDVVSGPAGQQKRNIRCISCFDKMATEKGLMLRWAAQPEPRRKDASR